MHIHLQDHPDDWAQVRSPKRIMAVCCTFGCLVATVGGVRWLSGQSFAGTGIQTLGVTVAFGLFGMLVGSFAGDALIEGRSRR